LLPLQRQGKFDGVCKMNPILPAGVEGFLGNPKFMEVFYRELENLSRFSTEIAFFLR
jgi:hypothetical protein